MSSLDTRECLVLAGGLGTRLGDLTKLKPKPLIEINGVPFLFYILDYLFLNNFSRVVICVSYKHDFFLNLIPSNYRGIEIVFSVEDTPLGTGGAFLFALNQMKTETFYMINADTFVSDSIIKFEELTDNHNWDIVCGLSYVDNSHRYGKVVFNDPVIESFEEKESNESGLINAGYYLIKKEKFTDLKLAKFSFEEVILHSNKYKKLGVILEGDFIDIGTPNSLKDSESVLKKFKKNKAIFIDRDGTINVDERGYTFKIKDLKFIEGVIEALNIISEKGYSIFIITNQSGVARGLFSYSEMTLFNENLITVLAEKGINIKKIYSCPHHPDGIIKKYSITCDCRKPMPKMILEAAEENFINLKYSYMVGDSFSDVKAGHLAKVKTILISEKAEVINASNEFTNRVYKNLKAFAYDL